jgi:hypothetical protein
MAKHAPRPGSVIFQTGNGLAGINLSKHKNSKFDDHTPTISIPERFD